MSWSVEILGCFTTFYDREIEQTDFTSTQPFADSILNVLSDPD